MSYLAESFCLSMLLETERREVAAGAEDLCFCEDTDTTNTVDFHFHVRVTVWVAKVGQVRAPCCVLCVTFHNDCVLIKGVCKSKRSLGFLPRVQIVWLFSTKPVRKRSPNI